MSKLVFCVPVDQVIPEDGSILVRCTSADVERFAHRGGEPVLIAKSEGDALPTIVALGRLESFGDGTYEGAPALLSAARNLLVEVQGSQRSDPGSAIIEISDQEFTEIISRGTGALFGHESVQPLFTSVTRDRFTAELAPFYQNRCSFSDVRTSKGTAFIIRPIGQGGSWHVSNFLFLDPEPGELFARFAWTVGPKFEIIINTSAVSPDVSDTVNRTGLVSLPENSARWPDRSALAWHFDQFTARIKSGA